MTGHLPFRVEILRLSETLAVLAVEGEVDVHADPHFRDLLFKVIAEGPRALIVDLTNATTLDCTGLGVLVSAARRASTSRRSCSSSFFSLRVLFQIFSGMATAKRVVA